MSASGSCYVDELLSLKCGGALLNLKLYPDMKELCESMAAWTHLRKYFSDEIAKPQKGDCLVVVGDGVKPRIGALCAFLARGWTCYSIDPQLQVSPNDARWVHDPAHKVSNLVCLRRKIQDVCIKANRVIFILMHAHVSLADTLLSVNATTEVLGVLSVPCCNNYEHQSLVWNQPPNFTFKDTQMLTERCEVRIWKNPRPLLIPPMRLVPCKNYSISDLRNHPVKKRALTLQSLASLAHFLKEHFSREDILIYHLNDPILSVLQEELLKGMEITACNILSEDPIDAKNYVVVDLLVMDFITAKYQINTCGRFVRALIGGAKSVVSVTMRDPVHLYRHVMSVSKVVCISEKSATQKFKMQFCVGRLLESFAQAVTPEVIVIKDHDMDSLISNSSRVYDILNLMESSRFAVDDQEVFSLCGVLSGKQTFGKFLRTATLWDVEIAFRPDLRARGMDFFINRGSKVLNHLIFENEVDASLTKCNTRLVFQNQIATETFQNGDMVVLKAIPQFNDTGSPTFLVQEFRIIDDKESGRIFQIDSFKLPDLLLNPPVLKCFS